MVMAHKSNLAYLPMSNAGLATTSDEAHTPNGYVHTLVTFFFFFFCLFSCSSAHDINVKAWHEGKKIEIEHEIN